MPRRSSATSSTSLQRNVFLDTHKTTVRLEPVMWEALGDIARTKRIERQELIRRISRDRAEGEGLTAAIRVYIVKFYRDRIGQL